MQEKKGRILLIQEDAALYNAPAYEIINQYFDLTVGYISSCNIPSATFKILQMPYISFGRIKWHINFHKYLKGYDVVAFVPHFSMVRVVLLPFLPHKFKTISWSIGVHVSYNRHYDLSKPPSFADKLSFHIQNKSDASVVYMPEPIEYWKKYKKFDSRKFFVAHNTVDICHFEVLPKFEIRDSIIFIGTLYRQKGLDELIDAYALALSKSKSIPQLFIIGKGPEKSFIEKKIKDLNLEHCITLCGPIYDECILMSYFFRSILCISPKQAGLSVLKSMGYGVPFVTRKDAITGGEINNIMDGVNGIFYHSLNELADVIIDVRCHPENFKRMSENARTYYLQNASIEKMAHGFIDATNFVQKKQDMPD